MNKKAQLIDWSALIVWVVVLIVFSIFVQYNFGEVRYEFNDNSEPFEMHVSLLTVMKTPIDVSGEQIELGEALITSGIHSLEEEREEISKVLDTAFGKEMCHTICINDVQFYSSACTSGSFYACDQATANFNDISGNVYEVKISINHIAEDFEFDAMA